MANAENVFNGATTKAKQATQAVRPDSIKEALRTLDEAIQSEGANLKDLVGEDYSHLRDALGDLAPRVTENLRRYGAQAIDQASEYAKQGIETGKQAITDVDARVRANPWPVIGGVAAGGLALGFLLGRSGRSEH